MVPEQALREKTSAFESQAYTNAESRTDYLKRIAGGLSNVERQVQQATSANANMVHPQANGTATTTTTPAAQVQGAVPRAGITPQQAALHRQQQQQMLQAHGQMSSNPYNVQMRQQLLMQQQHAKQQQLSAKAATAAARAKGGTTADVKVCISSHLHFLCGIEVEVPNFVAFCFMLFPYRKEGCEFAYAEQLQLCRRGRLVEVARRVPRTRPWAKLPDSKVVKAPSLVQCRPRCRCPCSYDA